MKKQAAIDSNMLIALVDSHDKWHLKAVEIQKSFAKTTYEFLYLDCVINETISVIARRTEEQKRSEQLFSLLDNLEKQAPADVISWLSSENRRLHQDIVKLVRESKGVLNYHDSMMALFCRENEIRYILSFDKDFDSLDWITRIKDSKDVDSIC